MAMASIRNLLVAVDDLQALPILLEKAERIAAPDTQLHVVQVIYEGVAEISTAAIADSTRLKTFILESAESQLEEALEDARRRFGSLESATLWNARAWEGVLHAATDSGADMILRATATAGGVASSALSVMRTPDEWNLLRHAPVPVLLVKPAAWLRNGTVLCALDVFDDAHAGLSVAVLRHASQLAAGLEADLDLVYAYPLFEPWVGELGAARSYEEIKAGIEEEARDRVNALIEEAGVSYRHLLLEEGHTAEVLSRLSAEDDASLLVVGTHAREGVRGVLLGNTSERILHAVDCDVLTVPAP